MPAKAGIQRLQGVLNISRHSGERRNPVYSICSGCPRIGMTFLDFLRGRQYLGSALFQEFFDGQTDVAGNLTQQDG